MTPSDFAAAVAAFDRRVRGATPLPDAPARDALARSHDDLLMAVEELQVAQEELHAQNDELARARDAAEAERDRSRGLLDLAPDGLLVTDAEGVVREANPAAQVLLGTTARRLVGKPLVLLVAAADRAAFHAELSQARRGPRSWGTTVFAEGGPRDVTVAVAPAGRGAGADLLWLLREPEPPAVFDAVAAACPRPVLAYDPASAAVLAANPAAVRLYGRGEGELRGGLLTDLCHPDDRADLRATLAAGGTRPARGEWRARAAGGAEAWVVGEATPLPWRGRRAGLLRLDEAAAPTGGDPAYELANLLTVVVHAAEEVLSGLPADSPLRAAAADAVAAACGGAGLVGRLASRRAARAVLLADDDPALLTLMAAALRHEGIEVVAAGGGPEALRAWADRRDRIAALVTDVQMPGLGGPELAAAVERDRPGLPVLFVSSAAPPSADVAARLLPKPFRPAELVEAVRRLLG